MPRRLRLALSLLVGVTTPACFDHDGAAALDTEGASSSGSSGDVPDSASDGPLDADSTSAAGEGNGEDADGSTTDEPDSTSTTDGGCMPGVFGQSLFGEACFQ